MDNFERQISNHEVLANIPTTHSQETNPSIYTGTEQN